MRVVAGCAAMLYAGMLQQHFNLKRDKLRAIISDDNFGQSPSSKELAEKVDESWTSQLRLQKFLATLNAGHGLQ